MNNNNEIKNDLKQIILFIIKYQKEYNDRIIRDLNIDYDIDDNLNNGKINNNKLFSNKDSLDDLTNLKLQKILYFLYGYYYGFAKKNKFTNEKLFKAEFEAWQYGPVIKIIYEKFEKEISDKYIINDNKEELEENYKNIEKKFKNDEIKKMKKILDYLFTFSAWVLVEFSHKTDPWKNQVKKNKKYFNKINAESIEKFFLENYKIYEKSFE